MERPLIWEQAHRLATMPRHRVSELLQGAFWAFLASLPGGVGSCIDLARRPPSAPLVVNVVGIGACAVALAFVVFAVFYRSGDRTSEEYLNELYELPETAPGKLRKLWREWFS
jgi:hypothetical protein